MDSPLSSQFDNKYYQYYEIVDIVSPIMGYPKPGIHDMITLLYTKYDREQEIVRQVTSVLDILSKSGGFASFMMALTLYITKQFQFSLFQQDLLKSLFKTNYKPKKKRYASQPDEEGSSKTQDDQLFSKIWESVITRKPLDINFFKLRFLSVLNFFCNCTRESRIQYRTEKAKLKGYTHLLNKQMDIVKMAEGMRKLKLLLYLNLSKRHRMMLPYLGLNLLSDVSLLNKAKIKLFNGEGIVQEKKVVDQAMTQNVLRKVFDDSLKKKKKDRIFIDLIMDDWKCKNDMGVSFTNTFLRSRGDNTINKSHLELDQTSKQDETVFQINPNESFRTDRKPQSITTQSRRKQKKKKENTLKVVDVIEQSEQSSQRQLGRVISFNDY